MIVMKFGGSSLASAASIRRVTTIVRSELDRQPIVVASAMGETTEVLLELLAAALGGNSYSAWKLQESLKDLHLAVSSDLLGNERRESIDQFLQTTFRDLHVKMLGLCEGESVFTPKLQDWTLSLGERISSRLLAAVLDEHCSAAMHLDASSLILTDDEFTNAQPRYWETYARIRWALPAAARQRVVVLGGFIGSTEDGQITTLGRGGSDLTASIVGAAVNAEEIQVWKDVDGMLTCDPKIFAGACKVKSLSYEEATELAHAGATILHPETMAPAKRLRIPIVIRNTFHPEGEGTRIAVAVKSSTDSLKSIAVKKAGTLLEVSVPNPEDNCEPLIAFCKQHKSVVTVLHWSERVAYVALDDKKEIAYENLARTCFAVKTHSKQAIVTLVGNFSLSSNIVQTLGMALQKISCQTIPTDNPKRSMRFAIPQHQLEFCMQQLHRAFFSGVERPLTTPQYEGAGKFLENAESGPVHVAAPRPFVLATALIQPN